MEFTIDKVIQPIYSLIPTTALQVRNAGVMIILVLQAEINDLYKVPKFRPWLAILNNNQQGLLPLAPKLQTGLG